MCKVHYINIYIMNISLGLFISIIAVVTAENQLQFACRCNKFYRPVCGSDGHSYRNPCMLKCAMKYNRNLSVAHYGDCSQRQLINLNQETDNPCICNKIYHPVCGTDDKTYRNPCLLDCAKRLQPDLSIEYQGDCNMRKEEDLSKTTICVCAFVYRPMCGTDGKTYSNLCMLNCMGEEYKDIKLAYEGECNENVCICDKVHRPVCGSDAKTYDNLCALRCGQKYNKELVQVQEGECGKNDLTCNCDSNYYNPLCGTDNKTYNNVCLFSCARDSMPEISIRHEGECLANEITKEEEQQNEACLCSLTYKPMCGTDSKTYSNICILNCMAKANSDITLAYQGECNKLVCICKEIYEPICGSNGQSFANACQFECDQKWNPELKKIHHGECKSDSVTECECNRNDKPTCGNDGKTYPNPCILGCEQANNPGLTIDHFGAC